MEELKDNAWEGVLAASLVRSSTDQTGHVKVKESSKLQVWAGFDRVLGLPEGSSVHSFSALRPSSRVSSSLGKNQQLWS